jgi:hypothetical protein
MIIYWPDSNLSLDDLEKNRIMAISIVLTICANHLIVVYFFSIFFNFDKPIKKVVN